MTTPENDNPAASSLVGGGKGDLLARLVVTVPKKLTKPEKEALEAYRRVAREQPRHDLDRLTHRRVQNVAASNGAVVIQRDDRQLHLHIGAATCVPSCRPRTPLCKESCLSCGRCR